MTEMPQGWRWRPPPGWPPPAPGWAPPPGWQPDPAWPPAPADWVWWEPVPQARWDKARPWFLAAGVMLPLSFVELALGLALPSLALVYVSIACGLIWVPLLIIGLVRLSGSRSAR